ncbi:LRR receptor-like serine/threonine-protein kinase GSO1 [Durio zibethinus]|uniref:LRR receptor-like serine/threonine-protein kinase GSO1 n=1 Tax=Durio zibethinus TaxID=66656 RepID=A0A6P5Z121_DURZI|nr:LRR receptor-like serine/threonine-protein kinase GSO1 [Durio zibethinus]
MRAVTISLFGFLLVIAATIISFCDGNSNVLCIESERQALSKFKQHLIDRSNRLSSWVEGEDCCEWVGVFCNNFTGHVKELHLGLHSSSPDIELNDERDVYFQSAERDAYFRSKLGGKINPSLIELKHLSFLDLSNNDFGGLAIPEFIGSMKSLTYLNLSSAKFSRAIPHNLGNLSKLHYLDLGHNSFFEAKTLQWVSGLSSLQYLDLSDANLTKATDWLQATHKLPSLVELHLSDCYLNNNDPSSISVNYTSLAVLDLSSNMLSSIPTWIFSLRSIVSIDLSSNGVEGVILNGFQNISSLKFLDLSWNSFSSSSTLIWLSNLNRLQFLGLRGVSLQGNFSIAIRNLSSLTHLDLSANQLEVIEPKCLESLCNLREMDLSNNGIDQEVSEIIESLPRCSLDRLESLNIASNQLSGCLPDQLGQFKNLAYLSLSGNSISGPVPFSIGNLSSLKLLDVAYNRLNATLPQSLGQLGNLEHLDVSNNMLEGNISEMHFSNLKRLRLFWASNNMLTFKPNPSWIPPFHCESIKLRNWHIGPQFPQWLQFQKNLSVLDISHAEISGVIPTWFWNLSTQFDYLNLSYNHLVGEISYLPKSRMVDLTSNLLTGPLPRANSNLEFLILSKNLFSGSLSNFLCNSSTKLEALKLLDIESNLLSGEIPDCWENQPKLGVLNLGNNNLTGKIPRSLGSLQNIMSLKLRTNNLFGEVPSTLQHLAYMLILDLSENQLTVSIPAWNGDKLLNLVVLNLRSNKFQAHIPDQICSLNSLHFLDLGYNKISGAIPKCFSNLKPLDRDGLAWGLLIDSYNLYYFGALLVRKGREDEYSTILGLVTGIDLSVNSLTGEIPKELGNLTWLQSLNLSGNLLTGKIPENIGNMKLLESLDLSMNRLHGEIPSSFSNLNFLNHLNLSYNNLTGQIPSGTQLQSFDRFSYIGNHLCGPPITKNCSGGTPGITNGDSSEGRHRSKMNWLYVSMVVGFVMGFWGVVAPLFFIRSWRFAYYKKLEHIGDKLYVFWATIAKTLPWVSGLSSLQYLDLSDANLTKAINWLQATHKLPSLVELHLSECSLNNNPSPISVNYKSLTVLDLPGNTLSSVPTWIFSLRSLESSDLKSNGVEDVIPNGFQNMSSLEFLDLSWNSSSSSSTLSWLSNLNQLQFLGLRHVGLQGFFQVPLET